jgi:ParE toxin of type II toxin-antitoxin system, parDE
MIVEFLAEAKAELVDAVTYYESELPGLGRRFWDDIDRHITWITENPDVPRLRDGGYRRVNLSVFPYYRAYIVRDPVIWILSVAHGHSLPEYWVDRS